MALNLTTRGLAETLVGLFCIGCLVCHTGFVQSAPAVSTVVLSTFDPTTGTKASGSRVSCETTTGSPATVSTFTPTSIAKQYEILSLFAGELQKYYNTVFVEYELQRFGGPPGGELMDISNLPDIKAVNEDDLQHGDRMATHYFIISGFRAAMAEVIEDESQINASENFGERFNRVEAVLGKVLQGTQDVICIEGLQGESSVGEPEGLGFTAASEAIRIPRDYTVLYQLHQYITNLYQYLLTIKGSSG